MRQREGIVRSHVVMATTGPRALGTSHAPPMLRSITYSYSIKWSHFTILGCAKEERRGQVRRRVGWSVTGGIGVGKECYAPENPPEQALSGRAYARCDRRAVDHPDFARSISG